MVTIAVTRSASPDNSPLTYTWDFGDGISGALISQPPVTYTYQELGNYQVSLTADDGNQFSHPDMAYVTVYDPVRILTTAIIPILLL